MLDITPRIREESDIPLYRQLYQYFREEIQAGRMQSGTRLPSVRGLAQQINISKTTVELAYHQLLAEGYIESRERSGFYVVELDTFLPEDETLQQAPEMTEVAVDEQSYRYDFHMARIDLDYFPFAIWRKFSNQVLRPESKELFLYGDRQGELGLRIQIARYLHQARGVDCKPEQIVIAAGTQLAILLICQMIGMNGQAVAMEEPGYQDVRQTFLQFGFQVKPISLEEDGLDVEALKASGARVVYVTPSHQETLGMVMPYAKRMKLLQWAEETNSLILEDDYDGEFRYRGKPIPSLQSLDKRGNVIYMGTFSKSLLPAIRLSYMVLPPQLAEKFREQHVLFDQTVSRLHQKTLELFMASGEWERHIRKMRVIYQKKHEIMLQAIKQSFGEHVAVTGQGAGLSITLEVYSQKSAEELVEIAREAGIRVFSTDRKWMNPPAGKPPTFQLGFGGLPLDEIEQSVQQLAHVWSPYFIQP